MKKVTGYSRIILLLFIIIPGIQAACNQSKDSVNLPVNPAPVVNEVDAWLTKGDQTVKLQKQAGVLGFATNVNLYPTIETDESVLFQTVDGFGFTLTGGSAQVISQLTASKKQGLMQEFLRYKAY